MNIDNDNLFLLTPRSKSVVQTGEIWYFMLVYMMVVGARVSVAFKRKYVTYGKV